jgi:hypothetical protein
MCGFCNVWVCVCVGLWGLYFVLLLVTYVLVFIVFWNVSTVFCIVSFMDTFPYLFGLYWHRVIIQLQLIIIIIIIIIVVRKREIEYNYNACNWSTTPFFSRRHDILHSLSDKLNATSSSSGYTPGYKIQFSTAGSTST